MPIIILLSLRLQQRCTCWKRIKMRKMSRKCWKMRKNEAWRSNTGYTMFTSYFILLLYILFIGWDREEGSVEMRRVSASFEPHLRTKTFWASIYWLTQPDLLWNITATEESEKKSYPWYVIFKRLLNLIDKSFVLIPSSYIIYSPICPTLIKMSVPSWRNQINNLNHFIIAIINF